MNSKQIVKHIPQKEETSRIENSLTVSIADTFPSNWNFYDCSTAALDPVSSNELNLKLHRLAIIVKLVHQGKRLA
ncbi:MAG: hypothetical protein ACOYNC_07240 [Bacteroidales bacterium]